MKLLLATAALAVMGCNGAETTADTSMSGAYKMLSQSIKGGKTDTTVTSIQQLKIFNGDFMMYASISPADSVSSFGIGTVSSSKDTVTEKVMFNASDSNRSENPGSFTLVITKTAKGYKQVIPEMVMDGEKYALTEEYETAGTASASPLDGAWKMTGGYTIKGKDSAAMNITQYKMYGGGYFIFGHTYADSVNKKHTGIGFGKFVMTGTNKSKESIIASTYHQVRGKDFDIEIEMNGTDEYKQTITEADGTKLVEIYQRLKK